MDDLIVHEENYTRRIQSWCSSHLERVATALNSSDQSDSALIAQQVHDL